MRPLHPRKGEAGRERGVFLVRPKEHPAPPGLGPGHPEPGAARRPVPGGRVLLREAGRPKTGPVASGKESCVSLLVCQVASSVRLILTCGDKYFPSIITERGGHSETWRSTRELGSSREWILKNRKK